MLYSFCPTSSFLSSICFSFINKHVKNIIPIIIYIFLHMFLFFFIFCLVFLYNCIIYRKTLRLKLQNGSEKTIISNNLFPILILLLLTQQILKTYTYHLFNLTFSSISSRRSLITYLHIIIYHQKKKKKVLKVL